MSTMRVFLITFLCLSTVMASFGAVATEEAAEAVPVCATGFDSPDESGLYRGLTRNKLVEVVEDEGVDGSDALKVTYRGYRRGSERVIQSFKLPRALTEATLVFDVKFDDNFQFTKGGKLHGLGPDNRVTGGDKVKPETWSARAMWHPKSLGTYVYCQDKDNKYGQGPDKSSAFNFEKERYYAVSIYVKLNEPAKQSNGSAMVYVDGKLVSEDHEIQFRSVEGDHTKITHLLFSTFHGGDSKSWAPKDKKGKYVDVHAYFDNFAVYEGEFIRQAPGE